MCSANQCASSMWARGCAVRHVISEVAVKILFTFSSEKYMDMHFVHRFCNGNATTAIKEYLQQFLWKRIPDQDVFNQVHQNGKELISGRVTDCCTSSMMICGWGEKHYWNSRLQPMCQYLEDFCLLSLSMHDSLENITQWRVTFTPYPANSTSSACIKE
jgi:hypothetical protein